MKPLTPQDLWSHEEYERSRASFRQHIIALKKRRRISVGPFITLIFENRETLLFQVQEMIRVERIVDPRKVQEELDVYNALLPESEELSATLFIEITEEADIQKRLDSFQNLDQPGTVCIQAGEETVAAEFEAGHSKEDKISAVHFLRFRPSLLLIEALVQDPTPALVIFHEQYQAKALVSEALRVEWLTDLGQVEDAHAVIDS